MSAVSDAFTKAFGKPEPAVPNGLHFKPTNQEFWDGLHRDIGSGWFKDGFLYLFGEGLDSLLPCLDAWSFLVPPNENRTIIGRNAYGAILVLDNPFVAYQERLCVLDPFTVTYGSDPNLMFINLIGRWLPRNELPGFLDDGAYED